MKFTNVQQQFIEKYFKQTKNDKLIENVSRLKSFIPKEKVKYFEEINEDDTTALVWDITINEASSKIYKCICGRSIKKQYNLKHKFKKIELSLGSGHYKEYCGISIPKVKNIINNQVMHNKRIDELQRLYDKGEIDKQKYLLEVDELPQNLYEQLSVGLPLIQQQLNTLCSILNKNIVVSISKFSNSEMTELNLMSTKDRRSLLLELKNGRLVNSLEELKNINYQDIEDRLHLQSNEVMSASEKAMEIARKSLKEQTKNIDVIHIQKDIRLENPNEEVIDGDSYKKNGINLIQRILKSQKRKTVLGFEYYGDFKWWFIIDETKNIRIEYIDKRYDVVELKRRFKACPVSIRKIEWIIDKALFDHENCRQDIKRYMKETSYRYPEILILDFENRKVVKKVF